mgnify:CR=1 FL=1
MIIGSAMSPQLWFQISHTKNAIGYQAALELSFINALEIKQDTYPFFKFGYFAVYASEAVIKGEKKFKQSFHSSNL